MENLKKRASLLKLQAVEQEKAQQKRQLKLANQLGTQVISLSRFVNAHNIMRLPLFSTKYSRNGRRTEPIRFVSKNGSIAFEVKGVSGIPSQVDANILRFAISKARKIRQQVGIIPEKIEVTRYELLKALGKKDSGGNYKSLEKSIECLGGMRIKGNIFRKDEIFTGSLLSFSHTYKEDGKIDKIKIFFNSELRSHLQKEKSVLAIPNEILISTNALKIRIMELVQAGMGHQQRWAVRLRHLRELCAYSRQTKFLKHDIKRLELPYHLSFNKTIDGDQVVIFTRKRSSLSRP